MTTSPLFGPPRALVALLCAFGVTSAACHDEGEGGAPRVLIYEIDAAQGLPELAAVEVQNLEHLYELKGEVAQVVQGGELRAGPPGGMWVIAGSETPSLEVWMAQDQVVTPTDFDSAMMLTLYHQIEVAAQIFDAFEPGRPESVSAQVGVLRCLYYPELASGAKEAFSDGAAYDASLDALVIPPMASLEDAVPAYANQAIITGQYARAVFNRLVDGHLALPERNTRRWSALGPRARQAQRELAGLEWGVAEFFGALSAGQPDALAMGPGRTASQRNVSTVRRYDACMMQANITGKYPDPTRCGGNYPHLVCHSGRCTHQVASHSLSSYAMPYVQGQSPQPEHLGSVIASTLWGLRELERVGDHELGGALLRALRHTRSPAPTWRLPDFLYLLLDELPADTRAAACAHLQQRLPALVTERSLVCQA